ncbi:MAG: 50S ribosome-binding GTPase [Mycoplasmatales bacterium]|nr:50S ribosome-binding GTPase [Mycoplasmatales bacterium]
MKFIDKKNIRIKAGNGGDGFISFLKSSIYTPAGGDGGDGSDIYLDVDYNLKTLFNINNFYYGENGKSGGAQNKNGSKGKDIIIFLPKNTKVTLNKEVIQVNNRIKILSGGKGGFGNAKLTKILKSKTPKEKLDPEMKLYKANKGEESPIYDLNIEMEFASEVGLLGKPSSGKSTLISKMTNFKAKIGAYDFTTLEPSLAIANIDDVRKFTMLDLPGIIKGAAMGRGKGDEVMEFILKTKVILHIIDFGTSYKNPINDFQEINHEIQLYSNKMDNTEQIVIANKMDIFGSRIKLKEFKLKFPKIKVIPIVAIENKGIFHLMEFLWKKINNKR